MKRMIRSSGVPIVVGFALSLAATFTPVAFAQNDVSNSISLQVYNCPAGVTADTLDPARCAPVTEGFDVIVISLAGVMPPLTPADASLDGITFLWDNDIIDTRGAGGPLAVRETTLPDGYTDYMVVGEGVELDVLDHWAFTINAETPTAFLTIYNFAPAQKMAGSITLPSTGVGDARGRSLSGTWLALLLILTATGVLASRCRANQRHFSSP